jgi:hypothetical protein
MLPPVCSGRCPGKGFIASPSVYSRPLRFHVRVRPYLTFDITDLQRPGNDNVTEAQIPSDRHEGCRVSRGSGGVRKPS